LKQFIRFELSVHPISGIDPAIVRSSQLAIRAVEFCVEVEVSKVGIENRASRFGRLFLLRGFCPAGRRFIFGLFLQAQCLYLVGTLAKLRRIISMQRMSAESLLLAKAAAELH
jgi:hypothetical protein